MLGDFTHDAEVQRKTIVVKNYDPVDLRGLQGCLRTGQSPSG
jgi:hypothetical protein